MARILLVNKFYYPRGGDCTAFLSLENMLKQHGHEVAIFSSQHELNLPSVWSDYFPSKIDFAAPGLQKVKSVLRLFFSKEVKTKFTKLLDDFKPDIVHVHNIHSYLSPYVVKIAYSRKIRVVWTLHDYKLLCPSYACLRDEKPCELCFKNKSSVVKYRCMKGDIKASILAYFEAIVWNRNVLEKYTSKFVSPSHFLKSKMVLGGFNKEKIEVLHNFNPKISLDSNDISKENYYCYIGRLSLEKGIDSLLEAAKDLPYKLKVVGGGDLLTEYKQKYKDSNIEFMGHLPNDQVLSLIERSRFTVVPSICYENNPFSIIESLCLGTPILGAKIGGIPELITEGENGFLFTPNDIEMLKVQIDICYKAFTDFFDFTNIRAKAKQKFDSEFAYKELMRIYSLPV